VTVEVDVPQLIRNAAQKLRQRDRALSKRCSEVRFTYWDCDDIRIQLMDKYFIIKRPDGLDIAVTGSLEWKHDEKLTLRIDQLLDLIHADPAHIDAILKTYREFGRIQAVGLTVPGLDEMKKYCQKMDEEIVETAKELKTKKVKQAFIKIWTELGGNSAPPTDRLIKRINYYVTVAGLFMENKDKWRKEMQRLRLL
jgi:hypothetical protein